MKKEIHAAIVLAGGRGSRMNSDVPKQFLLLKEKPLLYYSLKAMEDSFMDQIVLVTGEGQQDYCKKEIVEAYGFQKVTAIVPGGAERYDSVFRGLCALPDADYIYIHDGARPFVDGEILKRARSCVCAYEACAAGMPMKDTVKIVDEEGFVVSTPVRKYVWQIQTPQVFRGDLIRSAYEMLALEADKTNITDDAMVVESMLRIPVKLYEGSYRNIKITTPEDMPLARQILQEMTGEK